jgi:hypothetical protein
MEDSGENSATSCYADIQSPCSLSYPEASAVMPERRTGGR